MPAPRTRAPPHRWRRIVVAVVLAVVVGIPLGTAVGLYALYRLTVGDAPRLTDAADAGLRLVGGPRLPGRDPAGALPDWQGRERVNILLLGIDYRSGDEGLPRTDTMIVVTVDPVSKSAAMLSLPRDLWVYIPSHGMNRINSAYEQGEVQRRGNGPQIAARTVSDFLGVPIHHYVIVGFAGFEKLVNLVGGVTVDIERPIKDDQYPDEDYAIRRIYQHPGLQRLDGEAALWYVRTRHSDSDFFRARRQQRFLISVRNQAFQLNLLPKAPALLVAAAEAFKTDLPPNELLALAKLAREIDAGRVQARVIDETFTTQWFTPAGADVQVPRKEAVQRLVRSLFGDGRLAAEGARIEVQNGTPQMGLAKQASDWLEQLGLNVVRTTNAPSPVNETVIIDHAGKEQTRRFLLQQLRLDPSRVRLESPPSDDVDVRIILGRDFRLPAQ